MDNSRDWEYSQASVQLLISDLRDNPCNQVLRLSHTPLGNEGCEFIFNWLIKNDSTDTRPLANTRRLSIAQTSINNEADGQHQDERGCSGYSCGKKESQVQTESEDQRPPRLVRVIDLNDLNMGDKGLEAMVRYLEVVKSWSKEQGWEEYAAIQKICLRYNYIRGTSELALAFMSSLSYDHLTHCTPSSLASLTLSNNPLSADFKETLFSLLPSSLPSLQELYLNMTDLNAADAFALASYIEDRAGRCRLLRFHASANQIGFKGLKRLVGAISNSWTLEHVELYANGADESDEEGSDGKLQDDSHISNDELLNAGPEALSAVAGSGCGWKSLEPILRRALLRNSFLKTMVHRQALEVLRYSRILLLGSSHPRTTVDDPDQLASKLAILQCEDSESSSTTDPPTSSSIPPSSSQPSIFPFKELPTEVQLIILSQLGPILSENQLLRIFDVALDKSSLPGISPHLPSCSKEPESSCTPDPSIRSYNSFGPPKAPNPKWGSLLRGASSPGVVTITQRGKCLPPSGYYLGGSNSTVCQKDVERQKWFELVGCDAYDPGPTRGGT